MSTSVTDRNFAVLSTRRSANEVELTICEVEMPHADNQDDIVVEMLTAPINPSDIGTMLDQADPDTAQRADSDDRADAHGRYVARTVLHVPAAPDVDPAALGVVRRIGLEGAGRVVAAGRDSEAQALLGQVVSLMGTGTYARYVKARAQDSVPLGEETTAAQGAAALINPLTALAMVETMRREGFTALVHTAAASNLGQMLQRLCLAEGIGLVNIVRRSEHIELLRSLGAKYVLDVTSPDFFEELIDALRATGATLAFDAIGGGSLAGRILLAMEQAAMRDGALFPHGPRYGTTVPKNVYLYGGLDPSPVEVDRRFGMAWSIGGWLVFPFLEEIGPERATHLKRRAVDEITTTFASGYTRTIAMPDILDPDILRAISRRATGEKYLLDLTASPEYTMT